jgi:thioredoxin 1
MPLKTMEPNPAWAAGAHAETVERLGSRADELLFKVWAGDWCPDCRSQLPDFAAALDAAGVAEDRIEHYPVEKDEDGRKVGPGVDEYDIERIPTVVVERISPDATDDEELESRAVGGEEIARFVEEEAIPIADYLATELGERPADA